MSPIVESFKTLESYKAVHTHTNNNLRSKFYIKDGAKTSS